MTARALAREAGVSATTLQNWASLSADPLPTTTTPDGWVRFTWAQLIPFCEANIGRLPAAAKVLERVDGSQMQPGSSAEPLDDPLDDEQWRAVARNMKAAAHANLQSALVAARQAEESARAHREQLEAIETALAAYDDALTQLLSPLTPND